VPIVCRVEAGPHARNYEIYLTNAVSVEGLVKEFGLIRAVDELNLSIPKGQIVALLGGNGAGKTTTLLGSCYLREAMLKFLEQI
jgi:ABC-type uncharacterized transport system ATPase subunit